MGVAQNHPIKKGQVKVDGSDCIFRKEKQCTTSTDRGSSKSHRDWNNQCGRTYKISPACDPAKPGPPNDVARPHWHPTLQPTIQQVLKEYKLYQWTDSLQHPKSLPEQVHALTL